jgi:hypothetical protein
MSSENSALLKIATTPGSFDELVALVLRASKISDEDGLKYAAIVQEHFPEWSGKVDDINDITAILALVHIEVSPESGNIDEKIAIPALKSLPEIVLMAGLNLGLWLIAKSVREMISDVFKGQTFDEAIIGILKTFATTLNARRAGGKNSARWNEQIQERASEIFAECKRSRMTDNAAYIRVRQKLVNEGFEEFSDSTLRRYLK